MSATATATTTTGIESSSSPLNHRKTAPAAPAAATEPVPQQLPETEQLPQEQLYTPWRLAFYDFWVLGIVNSFAWCCPTTTYLLPLFRANVRAKHLDVGVGTGYYLDSSVVPATTDLTLVDNESHALAVAKARTKREDAKAVVADVLKPLPLEGKFGSVSMYFLLHCIPATVEEKCKVFSHIKEHMEPDGVLTGANILGKGVARDNFFGRFIRRAITEHGILKNADDNAFDFEKALRENFHKVETWVVGSVFIFRAEGPKA